MENISVGLLAHVDAGKTTLSEALLYTAGSIRKMGRVDKGDTFLDTFSLEKDRGITIFSKQARMQVGEREITLLDTPGHVDFSAEMERTLQVLDYAILVISGADGVQGHTQTLWKLLKRYELPVFLFVNKMDQPGTDRVQLLEKLTKQLDERCVAFDNVGSGEEFYENLAMCDEGLMEMYLEHGTFAQQEITQAVAERKVFPCYFGSALKMTGIEEFLEGFASYSRCREYGEEFAARVYKIARDDKNNRLTYLKVTGGSLKVKSIINGEKADQLRIYSGAQYELAEEVQAGCVCAVQGFAKTRAGDGLGAERERILPSLEPVLTYRVQLPEGCNVHQAYANLCQLEEEEPQLHMVWDEEHGEIHAQLMGEIQTEILKSMIYERYHIEVEFGDGSIVYKETIQNTVEGIGHFEPLRHYAEVHLLLEAGERGSGIELAADCSEDVLDKNWQRLILTHLQERKHRGVLTGSEITDMRLTLIAGRAHPKHTEGGDFRQATYRAVRQGLMQAESILLEPVYAYRLELPSDMVGHAMSDIQRMQGTFDAPEIDGDTAVITGTAPVVTMRGYQREVAAYTSGRGRLSCSLQGYAPCHNQEEVLAACNYNPEADVNHPTGSVFCAHGAGFIVPWDQVAEYSHVDTAQFLTEQMSEKTTGRAETQQLRRTSTHSAQAASEEELEEIFRRTYGDIKQKRNGWSRTVTAKSVSDPKYVRTPAKKELEEYLLVDGYNIVFAWDELKELAEVNLDAARDKLMDILSNYQGYRKVHLIVVFDAYKVKGNTGSVQQYHNISVVYTKEAETADAYIAKVSQDLTKRYAVTVATSDALVQLIIWGQGAVRMSARELYEAVEAANIDIRAMTSRTSSDKDYLLDHLPKDMTELMEDIRLGKREFPNV